MRRHLRRSQPGLRPLFRYLALLLWTSEAAYAQLPGPDAGVGEHGGGVAGSPVAGESRPPENDGEVAPPAGPGGQLDAAAPAPVQPAPPAAGGPAPPPRSRQAGGGGAPAGAPAQSVDSNRAALPDGRTSQTGPPVSDAIPRSADDDGPVVGDELAGDLEPQAAVPEPTFEAVAVAPTPGVRLQLKKVPRNVQTLNIADLEATQPLGLHDALNAQLGSVMLNDVQNNPLQPDLSYRGFSASPLLGTPQGIAVYQNGVRINEPFGDVLQWDLVPEFAIGEVQLVPGANPVYGLNALGASLLLRTKNGFQDAGHRVSLTGGSFSRYRGKVEYGDVFGDWALYLGADVFGEEGFRDESRSSAQHLFADLRTRGAEYEVGVAVTLGSTDLNGNGPTPVELLARDRSSLFTYPDNTQNQLLMVAFDGRRQLAAEIEAQGTAYLRHTRRGTLNGDEAEFETCSDADAMAEVLCDEQGEPIVTEAGLPIELSTPYDGAFNTSETVATGMGGSLQVSVERPLGGLEHLFVAGASYDGSHVDYVQRVEAGYLTERRGVSGVGVMLGGEGFQTELDVDNHYVGVYASDTLSLLPPLSLNLAARLNWATIELSDQLGDELNGDHAFVRVNPSVGLSYAPVDALTVFASYSESNRAPSAAELACADPDSPCRLPNAFIADPPLQQVVTRAVEIGLRGQLGKGHERLTWSLAGYGTRNWDDIIFVAASRVGSGYFRNAGQTQRLGLEASVSGAVGRVSFYASYGLVRATFETELEVPNTLIEDDDDDDDDDDGGGDEDGGPSEQSVAMGTRIPGIPMHGVKAGLRVRVTDRWGIGLSGIAHSDQPFRGDEAGVRPRLPGYAVVNLNSDYELLENLRVLLKITNLLNTEYETFGVIADPSEVVSSLSDPRFVGPAPPFGIWGGVELFGM